MHVSLLIASLLLAYIAYCVVKTTQVYLRVRKSGFPIWISPFGPANPLWSIFGPLLSPSLQHILPYSLWRVLDLAAYGFEWRDHIAGRAREAPGYMIVHASDTVSVYLEDPELACAVLGSRRNYPMDPIAMKFLNVVGANLTSTEGDDWQRQRRLIAPLLNESIMDSVWSEACEQSGDMLDHFMASRGETDGTVDGLRTIAFNVLRAIGYGTPQRWGQATETTPPGHKMVYTEAIRQLIDGFIVIAVVPSRKILKLPFMPKVVRGYGDALDDFKAYTRELIRKEADTAHDSPEARHNLLSLLATVSGRNAAGTPVVDKRQTLSEEEIIGNLYQFTLAGFDTTANTLAYAVMMLAIHPELQDWIIEEIDEVAASEHNTSTTYKDTYSKLRRCLALMYETLRIYTPVAHVVRESARDQVITSGSTSYHIPAGACVTVTMAGIHLQKQIWGEDATDFRPSRWLDSDKDEQNGDGAASATPSINFQPPVKGAFLPWSAGPRVCPGMKMAQVEFVAVCWSLFRKYRVNAMPRAGGESLEEARLRLRSVIADSSPKLTLQMNNPQNALMKWTIRNS